MVNCRTSVANSAWRGWWAAALLLSLPVAAQIIPPDSKVPVQVIKGTGELAKKLNGAKWPTGKGWKAVTDQEQRLQLMVPEKWRVDNFPDNDAIIKAYPPGDEKNPKAALLVTLFAPRDDDPLEVTEAYATSYASELSNDKQLARLQFKATDSGYVIVRGMKFALAAGTMVGGRKKDPYRQAQLVYVSSDRIVTVQFSAQDKEYGKYEDDIAAIFASYLTLGMIAPSDD